MIPRRVFLGGALAFIAIPTSAIEPGEEWEIAQFAFKPYPDDWHFWPEERQKMAQSAIDRFLRDNPDMKVIKDFSYGLNDSDPRFPEGEEWVGRYCLVRSITVIRRIA